MRAAERWAPMLGMLRRNKHAYSWSVTWAPRFQGHIKTSMSLPRGMAISKHKIHTALEQSQTELSMKIRNVFRLKTQLSPDQQDHLKVLSHVPQKTTSSHRLGHRPAHRKMVPVPRAGGQENEKGPWLGDPCWIDANLRQSQVA